MSIDDYRGTIDSNLWYAQLREADDGSYSSVHLQEDRAISLMKQFKDKQER